MKEYYIDFHGYCWLKANSVDEVIEKFYDSLYGKNNEVQDLNLEINCIEENDEWESDKK